ncbi:hypothetical protein BpHYR1_026313 [Brachionus plicatilis]|uniref:Uncharacterized protein n=1 Tax=Brachionus plicatilis TaxID=10195 RepID=A0A3M7RN71_BRAPC|nr:hypothetical protein BpHYR1_026313 [Brachionus plicatilis]
MFEIQIPYYRLNQKKIVNHFIILNYLIIDLARPQKAGVCWKGCYINPSPWENGSRRSGSSSVIWTAGPLDFSSSSCHRRGETYASTSPNYRSEQGVQADTYLGVGV